MPGCLRDGKDGDRGTVNERESGGGDSERWGGEVGMGEGRQIKYGFLQGKHRSPEQLEFFHPGMESDWEAQGGTPDVT